MWFNVYACETDLGISWADDGLALEEEDRWKEEGGRAERVRSRTISIAYYEKLPRSNKSHGRLFYEGPEIKVPTRTFTVPANTRAVIGKLKRALRN